MGLRNITMNKASGSDGIPGELFKILEDDIVLHAICQQCWKTQKWPQNWKRSVFITIPKKGNGKECSNYHTIALISHARSVFIPIPKKGNAKECSNYHTTAFISHTSKVMLKILQARLQ